MIKRRKPLKRSTKPIRRRTLKRARQEREYDKLNPIFLREHPVCMVCWQGRSNQTHHIDGRIGARLIDFSRCLAVCQGCHDRIGREGKWARVQGFRTL